MNAREIELQLYGICKKFLPEGDLNVLWENGRALPLTGAMWNFDAINMTYFFFEIEQAFTIYIHPELLENYQFNSVNSIISVVQASLKDQLE